MHLLSSVQILKYPTDLKLKANQNEVCTFKATSLYQHLAKTFWSFTNAVLNM